MTDKTTETEAKQASTGQQLWRVSRRGIIAFILLSIVVAWVMLSD